MDNRFKSWAIVELMGHSRMAGFVEAVEVAGHGMLRVDVPECEGHEKFTRYVSPSALYAMTPVTEETARRASAAFRPAPVQLWQLPALPQPANVPAVDESDPYEKEIEY